MKVLFDHPWPFALAHGGLQTQIEQTKAALERQGTEVEYMRWWDDRQTGDVIHYFGRPSGAYIDFAHAKQMKVVVAELLTGLGSRPALSRYAQKSLMKMSQAFLPETFTARMGWDAYQKADGFVALTEWEAYLMQTMFGAHPDKIRVIANGVEEVFFAPKTEAEKTKGDYLVCTATVHPRKRVLEVAEAAAVAKVPVWIIGKPYSESDSYYLRFLEMQKKHSTFIRYEGSMTDRAALARVYREARGFVLLSTMESNSLSSLEAAASGCSLLLGDLPWAKSVFGPHAMYAPAFARREHLASILRDFFNRAPSMKMGFKPSTWDEIAAELLTFYRSC
jgi:glycosyltransferase involved in cell wall biosynthesis